MEGEVDAFALLEEALQLRKEEEGDDDDIDSEALFANPACSRCVRRGVPTLVALSDGDYHVCFGTECPHAVVDKEKQIVCELSGYVVGAEHKRDGNASWTGRSTTSANPDDNAGTPAGGWARRRDMFAASAHAWSDSAHINVDGYEARAPEAAAHEQQEQQEQQPPKPPPPPRPSKRGASCVDEEPRDDKRPRSGGGGLGGGGGGSGGGGGGGAPPREALTREALSKLEAETMGIVDKLFCAGGGGGGGGGGLGGGGGGEQPPRPPLDARLQNLEFVRRAALMRYVRACLAAERAPTMAGVHDVCVHANEFVREQRRLAAAQGAARQSTAAEAAGREGGGSGGVTGQVRRLVAQLVVNLWRAATLTPYMTQARRGNDSFRPFAAGVLYQFKRGLYMNDGTCVIPHVPTLAAHLPALRCPKASAVARQLQSCSHRGVCSLHRSLSSVSEATSARQSREIAEAFAAASRVAAMLREVAGR